MLRRNCTAIGPDGNIIPLLRPIHGLRMIHRETFMEGNSLFPLDRSILSR